MGEKNAKLTAASSETAASLVDALAPLGDVTSRKMFGGNGVFADGVMFALVDSAGTAFLRVSDQTRGRYEAAGSTAHEKMPYHAIPEDVLGDEALLREWGAEALAVARAAKR